MSTLATLRRQPGGFWIGVGLAAEAPAMLAVLLTPAALREQVAAAVFTSPGWALLAVAGCLVLFFGTAWAAVGLGVAE